MNIPNIYAGLFDGELDWIRQLQEAHRIYLRCEMVIVKSVPVVPCREIICLGNYWSLIKNTETQRLASVCRRVHKYNRW